VFNVAGLHREVPEPSRYSFARGTSLSGDRPGLRADAAAGRRRGRRPFDVGPADALRRAERLPDHQSRGRAVRGVAHRPAALSEPEAWSLRIRRV